MAWLALFSGGCRPLQCKFHFHVRIWARVYWEQQSKFI